MFENIINKKKKDVLINIEEIGDEDNRFKGNRLHTQYWLILNKCITYMMCVNYKEEAHASIKYFKCTHFNVLSTEEAL